MTIIQALALWTSGFFACMALAMYCENESANRIIWVAGASALGLAIACLLQVL